MATPYELGWRQASVFARRLTTSVTKGASGTPAPEDTAFDAWIVAAEDCTLFQADAKSDDALIELRPVLTSDPPDLLGIRSRKFKLTAAADDPRYCDDETPRLMISPLALGLIDLTAAARTTLEEDRRRAFKAWLSHRYARAAVPEAYGPLAKAIYRAHLKRRAAIDHMAIVELYWDVQEREDDGRTYDLFALIEDEAQSDDVKEWLYSLAENVPRDLGEVRRIEAGTEETLPIAVLTRTYLMTSELTWGK